MAGGRTPILWGPRYYAKRSLAKRAGKRVRLHGSSASFDPALSDSGPRRTTRTVELTRWLHDRDRRAEQTFLDIAFGGIVDAETLVRKARVGAHAVVRHLPDTAGALILVVGALQHVFDVRWAPGVLVQLVETVFFEASRFPFRMVFVLDGGMPEYEIILNETSLGTQRDRLAEIEVHPLTQEETLAEAKAVGLSLTNGEVQALHRVTGGHPYFVLNGLQSAAHGQLTGSSLLKLYSEFAPSGGPFDSYFGELDRAATAIGAEFVLREPVMSPADGPIRRFIVEWGLEAPRPPVIEEWGRRRYGAR